ncbi:MAG: tyrosine-type recombinase/integrase [Caldilineaceae bacterium]|nr:tyrosine-type recombinase/integrase [Caldilineaceae bacterium]
MSLEQRFPLLQQSFDIFLLDAESRSLTQSTITYYRQRVGRFLDWCETQNITFINELNTNHLRSYLVYLQRKGLASQSQHTAASAIRAFLNFCVTERWLDESPMARLRMPRVEKKILSALDVAEVHRLLSACVSERDKAIVLCLLDTGCRASEFVGLNGGDVNLKDGSVRVLGKGRKERITYLGVKARKQLMRYYTRRGTPGDNEPVWISEKGGTQLTYSGLHQILKRLGKRATIENSTPHRFRRTFALWCLRSGMNIFSLQRLMGHSDIDVLQKYLALVERDLQDAHHNHGAVDTTL